MSVSPEHFMAPNSSASFISRKTIGIKHNLVVALPLCAIVLLGAFLRFYQLGASGFGNLYYAATVKSMMLSWHNFFFAAFEPGASVTVDKPPLGFWVQVASAYLFGFNGFALALPQALAGVLSIPLLYAMVKRAFGAGAGLVAASTLAITPVTIATERNNTMDGLLVFVLLLAAWAFAHSIYSGKLRYLMLGTFIVGAAFNIKMLQAFMPLPAFYIAYLLGARHAWLKRIAHLTMASVLLAVVSLSWAVIVDLTPTAQRPYIGSSRNNTVMELIMGHNGLSRLFGGPPPTNAPRVNAAQSNPAPLASPNNPPMSTNMGQLPPPVYAPNNARPLPPPQNNPSRPNNPNANNVRPLPPPQNNPSPNNPPNAIAPLPPQGNPPPNGVGPQMEVGQPGIMRLFITPLVDEASWVLPLAWLCIPVIVVAVVWKRAWDEKHWSLALWSIWFLAEALYFSFTSGIMHAYYLIMLGPPIAALVGMGAWAFTRARWSWVMAWLFALATIIFQIVTLQDNATLIVCVIVSAGMLLLLSLITLRIVRAQPIIAIALMLCATLVAPLLWSALTTFNANPNVMLPNAGPSAQPTNPLSQPATQPSAQPIVNRPLPPAQSNNRPPTSNMPQPLWLDYLQANAKPDGYLLATLAANDAAPYILATGKPVLTFGGFSGSDNIVDAQRLAQLVTAGKVRFVLGQGLERKSDLFAWVKAHCASADVKSSNANQPMRVESSPTLFDCGKK
jgi:4-amino-4-deoxy-L-arabinose transferase-like glycosyltransferase